MGKSKKNTNKVNNSQCYVLLSRKLDDLEPKTEIIEGDQQQSDEDAVVEVRESSPAFNLTSFERIRDATMESNELIKEMIYNVQLLRKEVAELTKHVTNGHTVVIE